MATVSRLLSLLAILPLLAACAVNPRVELADLRGDGQPRREVETPFFPQEENLCGPAALATVLVAADAATSPDLLAPQVYLPEREGSLQVELMTAARRAGRIPYPLDPNLPAILAEIDADRPVLVLQNLRTPGWPAWHYAVITGYDSNSNSLRLNSGAERGIWVRAPRFLRTWDWGGRWAIVTLAPGELPATAEPESVFEAIARFESVAGAAPAEIAWRAAARRWPQQSLPFLALGNLAWQDGDPEQAARWYQQGLAQSPGDPALLNNLASILGELGCANRGEALLQDVAGRLRPGDPWFEQVTQTQAELQGRQQSNSARAARCDEISDVPNAGSATGG